ncbi:hypothetical protein GCM10022206_74220 [Streptomyces chiangmaiensis]
MFEGEIGDLLSKSSRRVRLPAYKPKMLALTGALGNGWFPSIEYLPQGAESLPEMNARIDEAAGAAGRSPSDVRRLMNFLRVQFSPTSRGLLEAWSPSRGTARAWTPSSGAGHAVGAVPRAPPVPAVRRRSSSPPPPPDRTPASPVYQILDALQNVLNCWTGLCTTCHQPLPRPRTRRHPARSIST